MCAMLSRRYPISPSRAAEMLANPMAPGVLSSDASNPCLNLEQKAGLDTAERRDP